MSRSQRLTFLMIAVVIAIVAAVALTAGSDDGEQQASQPASETSTPTATNMPDDARDEPESTPTPTPTPPPPPLLRAGRVEELRVDQGEAVRFRARSDEAEEIHVHGYDLTKDVEAGQTVTMSFKADLTGIFEIEFEHAGEEIAQLRVDPK
jgi:hypothetical protein